MSKAFVKDIVGKLTTGIIASLVLVIVLLGFIILESSVSSEAIGNFVLIALGIAGIVFAYYYRGWVAFFGAIFILVLIAVFLFNTAMAIPWHIWVIILLVAIYFKRN